MDYIHNHELNYIGIKYSNTLNKKVLQILFVYFKYKYCLFQNCNYKYIMIT